MSDENLNPPHTASSPRDLVGAVVTAALTSPASLDLAKIAPVIDALNLEAENYDRCRLALCALAAIFYSRPDLIESALLDRLAEIASAESLPGDLSSIVILLFASLASSPAAAQAWMRLRTILLDQRLSAKARARMLPLVGDFVRWREDLVGLDGILELAESFPAGRAFLLDHGVERFVFCAPESFTTQTMERIAKLFENVPRYRYVLRFLAARQSLTDDVRSFLTHQLDGRFPLRDPAAAILFDRPVRLLVVMNIELGQGDEIVRLAPLLQALLDANPALVITLITRRTYLYESQRVKTVSVKDDAAVAAALAQSFEGVIEIFQPDRLDFAHRPNLHAAVEELLAKCRPAFFIAAELGRAEKGDLGIRSEFLYQTVKLAGRDVAHSSRLDQVGSGNIYEPCLRLIGELGLPQRVAEEMPLTASLLTGVRSAEAERVWSDLVAQDSVPRRPTALVNPFGGAAATKGFVNQDEILAADIGGLVDEGYLVVVLPNGTPWGRREAILSLLSHIDPQTRTFVRVAPDPAETDRGFLLDLSERPDLVYADRVMRLFKYFATYADVVITVEGWLAHLAYNLARPFRLFLANGSFTPGWFPYGRGPGQRLVTALSPRCRASYADSELLRGRDRPPLPHGPRKQLLELALSGLGDQDGVAALRHALTSPDCDVRRYALIALGRLAPAAAKRELLAALEESAPTVVRAAAEALLKGNVDCSRELGPKYRELLQIELDVQDQNWDVIVAAGAIAFPALFRAAKCESYVLGSQAQEVLRQVLPPFMSGSPDLVSNPAPPHHHSTHRTLLDILRKALILPDSLEPASLSHASDALQLEKPDKNRQELCELALATIAAVLYSRPDLVDAPIVERLADLLATRAIPESIGRDVVKLFAFLATSPNAPHAWSRISGILRDERLDATTREWMLSLTNEFVQWREDVVGLDGVIALAEAPSLADKRTYLFDEGIERFVFSSPESFNVERLLKIEALFSAAPRYPYVLCALAEQKSLTAEARGWVAREIAGRFPFRERSAAVLEDRPVALFVALNVGMGQGDDMVRLVPLLQGLLDANPALSITLATWRTYLYDNPRITTVPITDDAAVKAALARQFDGVIEFFQPEWLDFTFRIEAHSAIEEYLAQHQPALLMKGDLGRESAGQIGNRLAFLYQIVKLGGVEIAKSRGLDQCMVVRNVYEPTMRLLAELGLPQRTAEASPRTPSVLTGTPSTDAARLWADLTRQESTSVRDPIALLNPFGGSGITKGFLAQDALLSQEIGALVAEGFVVVVLPNGQTWGRRSTIDGVLNHLEAHVRAHVRVAPDPAETDEAVRVELSERSTLAYNDRVMRAFKYFAEYADLVVTTEGWLAHLAYNLGRPMRLFLAAGSYSPEYHPRFRGRGQRLVAALSEGARAAHCASALLREGDPPPLPHRPRKPLLELALTGLGRFGDASDAAPLRLALPSPDPDVRTWTMSALGRVAPAEAKVELIAGLQDRWPGVAREAAQALLRGEVDCSRELGSRYRDVLQAHIDIDKQNWKKVARLGPIVLPALFKAAECDIHDVKLGAKALLREMLAQFIHDPVKSLSSGL